MTKLRKKKALKKDYIMVKEKTTKVEAKLKQLKQS